MGPTTYRLIKLLDYCLVVECDLLLSESRNRDYTKTSGFETHHLYIIGF